MKNLIIIFNEMYEPKLNLTTQLLTEDAKRQIETQICGVIPDYNC